MHLNYLFLLSLIALDATGLPLLPDSGQPLGPLEFHWTSAPP
jgi:hypothetical protein